MSDDNTTTILPSGTNSGFVHTGGGHNGHGFGDLLLSERISNSSSFNHAAIDRVAFSTSDIRREVERGFGEIKYLISDKAAETKELVRAVDNNRLRDELLAMRTEIVALRASAGA